MTGLEVEGFTVVLSGATILEDVSMSVLPGEVHAVIGPNGAGKTTLVNAVTGLVPRTAGHMLINGAPCRAKTPDRIARSGVARTFQHADVFRTLTAREHVFTGSSASSGRENAANEAMVKSLVDEIGPGLSATFGLMQVRLTDFARALAGNPVVLLLDEPASGLDEGEREEILQLITDIKKAGIAVMLIEHDMRLVLSVADKVTVLDAGRVVFSGSPDDVMGDAAVSRAYLGK